MTDDPKRGFGIADGLILVAGIAAGLGAVRAAAPGLTAGALWDAITRDWSFDHAIGLILELGSMVAAPFLAAIIPACLIVQIRPPRPRWRRLARQPGFMACLAAMAAVGFAVLVAACWLGASSKSLDSTLFAILFGCSVSLAAGPAVLSCWGTMLLCGAWRPRPTWQDRLGRLVGVGWIVLGAIGSGFLVFSFF